MDHKAGPLVNLKIIDEQKGEVEAVFSTLKAIDKDGDVTLPGAFGEQNVRISAYNHQSWQHALPVGKGTIYESGDTAVVKAQFFMDTQAGRDHFTVVKELGDLMEWSYGFDIDEKDKGTWPPEDPKNARNVRLLKKLKVHEVSPVILGAGVDTRTLSAKSLNEKVTKDNIGKLKEQLQSLSDLLDSDNPPTVEDVQKMVNSMMSTIGTAGKSIEPVAGLKLVDHIETVGKSLDELVNRIVSVVTQRAEEGKQLGDTATDAAKELLKYEKRLKEVLTTEPPKQMSEQLIEQIFRDSRALLMLSNTDNGGSSDEA